MKKSAKLEELNREQQRIIEHKRKDYDEKRNEVINKL